MEDFCKGDADGSPVKTANVDLTKKIKQSNRLIEANYYLSDREQKFILLYISQLDKNAPDFCQIELPISQIKEALKLGQDYPKVLWNICKNIMEKVLTLYDKFEGWYMTHWIQSVRYNSRKQTISLLFDKKLRPDLLQLQEAYVSADTALCLQFKGKYTARFYMLVRQYLRIGNRILTIADIIQKFELPETYQKRISHIKDAVVDPSLTQIKARSDITFEYEYLKEGRRVTALRVYNIRLKEQEQEKKLQEQKQDFAQSLLDKIGDSDKIRVETDSNYDGLVSLGLYPMIAKKIIAAYDKERIAANIDYVKKQKGIVKKVGYLLAAIADDYASTAAEMQRIKDEEKERERQKIQERLETAEMMKNLNTMIANTATRDVPQKFRDFLVKLKAA